MVTIIEYFGFTEWVTNRDKKQVLPAPWGKPLKLVAFLRQSKWKIRINNSCYLRWLRPEHPRPLEGWSLIRFYTRSIRTRYLLSTYLPGKHNNGTILVTHRSCNKLPLANLSNSCKQKSWEWKTDSSPQASSLTWLSIEMHCHLVTIQIFFFSLFIYLFIWLCFF